MQELYRCDKIIRGLGFDKNWSVYYHNSRNAIKGLKKNQFVHTIEIEHEAEI